MYCLLNDDEILSTLAQRLLKKLIRKKEPDWYSLRKLYRKHNRGLLDKKNIRSVIKKYVAYDLQNHLILSKKRYKKWYRPLVEHLGAHFQQLTQSPERRNYLVNSYLKSKETGFIKNFAPQLAKKNVWVISTDTIKREKTVLIRNIKNNQNLIKFKLSNNLPFWFIDSGYTNFLYDKGKPWHRIVYNHIHHSSTSQCFPADRLQYLPSFPRPWRKDGKAILVIESSDDYLRLFGTNLNHWKATIKKQITTYSKLPIEFRKKDINRKTRSSLYQELKNRDDIYCVITESSAAAIEAIWLGIPVITLNRHITNTVSRSKIQDINNLYRGPIGDWLCELTYSQFSFQEIRDGTARSILREYHNV